MKQIKKGILNVWQFEKLSSIQNVDHLITDRHAQLQAVDFNISYTTSPDPELVKINRASIAASLNLNADHLFFAQQTHETNIVHVKPTTQLSQLTATDAMICNTAGLGLAIMTADCVPILLYDQRQHAIGGVHAGWRGTVGMLVHKTLNAMQLAFGTQAKDIIAGIGPSICQQVYEVGDEVIEAVKQNFKQAEQLLEYHKPDKAKLDLWKANEMQLLSFGVLKENVEIAGLCTFMQNQSFFSARKGDSGRMASAIALL